MSITRIKSYGLSDGAVTTEKISNNVSLGVKISNIQIANSAYSVLDDTAIALGGGYLVITGAGFAAGCQVIVGANTATSTTFVNSTTLRAQVGAADAGTKTVYVVNTDGGTAIRVNGLTYSATPTWVTGSTLTAGVVNQAISIQLDASLATSYQLQTGSSLPAGLSLAANGLLTGTVTGIGADTTYSFTIEAIDAENQESPRSFSITVFLDPQLQVTTGLYAHFDSSNNSTYTMSGSNVVQWRAKNNSNIQMRPYNTQYGIKSTAGSLSRQVMSFNNYQYWIYDSVQTTMDDFSIFMLMSVPVSSFGGLFNYFGTNQNISGQYMGLGESSQGNGSEMDWIYGFANDARFSLSGNNPVNVNSITSGLRLYVIESTGSRDGTTVRVNQTNASMSFTGSNVSLSWKLSYLTTQPGSYPFNGTQNPFFGLNGTELKLAELIVYNGKLTSVDRNAVEQYLVDKWGTLS